MRLSITSKVKFEESDSQMPNQYVVNNDLIGSSTASYNDFKIAKVNYRSFSIKYGDTFNINIFEALNMDASKLAYLYIQFCDTVAANIQNNDLRFSLSIDTVSLGEMSQFQMMNVKNFASDINIDFVKLSSTISKGVLTIVAGEK